MVIHISGEDWFRAKQFLDQELANYRTQGFAVFRMSTLDDSWFDQARHMANPASLFGQKYCIVVALEAKKGRAGVSEGQDMSAQTSDQVKQIVQAFLENDHVLFVWNRGAKSAFPSKSKKIRAQDFALLKGEALITWAVSYAHKQGLPLEKTVARFLCEACAGDGALIAHEIEKLALFGSAREKELISYSITGSYFAWMQDVLQKKWHARAGVLQFDEHEASQRLAGLLNALRIILVARSPADPERAAFLQTANSFWVQNLMRWSQEIETQEIERWFAELLRFDIAVRTYKMTEPEALERFAFAVME